MMMSIAVTAKTGALEALAILKENKDYFDIVVTDVTMPDIDGFKLLELIRLETDIPVISKTRPQALYYFSNVSLSPFRLLSSIDFPCSDIYEYRPANCGEGCKTRSTRLSGKAC